MRVRGLARELHGALSSEKNSTAPPQFGSVLKFTSLALLFRPIRLP